MKYFIYVRGKKVPVSKKIYKEYWQVVNHEKYVRRLDIKNGNRPFSDYADSRDILANMADPKMDIEKIIETKQIMQLLYDALLTLTDDEFRIVKEIFFEEKSLTDLSKEIEVSVSTVARRRDKILRHLKKLLE